MGVLLGSGAVGGGGGGCPPEPRPASAPEGKPVVDDTGGTWCTAKTNDATPGPPVPDDEFPVRSVAPVPVEALAAPPAGGPGTLAPRVAPPDEVGRWPKAETAGWPEWPVPEARPVGTIAAAATPLRAATARCRTGWSQPLAPGPAK